MKQTLLLLMMNSLCTLSVGHKRFYHFFNASKTWFEAEQFCTDYYSDLASVDQNSSHSVCPKGVDCKDAWVRRSNLPNAAVGAAEWHWICGEEYHRNKTNWKNSQHEEGNCAYVAYHENKNVELSWHNRSCGAQARVICYDSATQQYNADVEVAPKTWLEALHSCETVGMSLVSGHDQVENGAFNDTIYEKGPSFKWWIGLTRDESGAFCAKLDDAHNLQKDNCTKVHPFICYDDKMVLVKEKMTFEEALVHCREHYSDLAMMRDEHEQRMVQKRANMADTEFIWVGLHFACFFEEWLWVNGHWVSSDHGNWKKRDERHGCDVAGAMQKNGRGKWFKRPLGDPYHFVCEVH